MEFLPSNNSPRKAYDPHKLRVHLLHIALNDPIDNIAEQPIITAREKPGARRSSGPSRFGSRMSNSWRPLSGRALFITILQRRSIGVEVPLIDRRVGEAIRARHNRYFTRKPQKERLGIPQVKG